MAHSHDPARRALRALGLSYPETTLKRPWPEHLDLVVRGKTFVFMNVEGLPLRLSFKLPRSRFEALEHAFASPTGYGLGRSGWVTVALEPGTKPALSLLKRWLDESYRAQAPKSLVSQLDVAAPTSARAAKKPPAKANKPAAKMKKAPARTRAKKA